MKWRVDYAAGPYQGYRIVTADDEAEAITKVKADVKKTMSLAMYAESYRVEQVAE